MSRLLVVLPLFVAVGCGYGFNPTRSAPPTKRPVEPLLPAKAIVKKSDPGTDQQAIHAALDALQARSKELFDGLKADAQPSAVKRLADDLAAAMKAHDLGAAPADFKAAWERHARAWRGLRTAVSKHADAYEGTDFTDALTGLFKDDPNRGKSLGGDMVEAVKAVTKTHNDLFAAAEQYGVEVEK